MDGLGTAARSDGAADGDTVALLYSLEFGLVRRAKARLVGVNTAETYGRPPGHPERLLGEQQTAFTRSWLAAAHQGRRDPWPLIVEFHGFDKYGRDLAVIRRRAGGPSLNQALIEAFPAVAVPLRHHQPPLR